MAVDAVELSQFPPMSVHIGGAGWHVNDWQVSPAAHSLESMQSEPMPLPIHMPPMQRVKPQQSRSFVHAEPLPWQQRRPESDAWHVEPLQQVFPGMMPPSRQLMLGPAHCPHAPPWQWSEEPVHSPLIDITSVVQHICPSVPQSLGAITHMRIAGLQTSPSMQTLCGAHGWPMPPIVVLPPHMPAVQVSPPEQVAPGAQHG